MTTPSAKFLDDLPPRVFYLTERMFGRRSSSRRRPHPGARTHSARMRRLPSRAQWCHPTARRDSALGDKVTVATPRRQGPSMPGVQRRRRAPRANQPPPPRASAPTINPSASSPSRHARHLPRAQTRACHDELDLLVGLATASRRRLPPAARLRDHGKDPPRRYDPFQHGRRRSVGGSAAAARGCPPTPRAARVAWRPRELRLRRR